jgi:sporulation protein YlmC with PRC-barrel domain
VRGATTDSESLDRLALRYALAVLVALAAALAGTAPAEAQRGRKPAADQADRTLVGLPIYSSDGKRLGRILALGVDDDNRPVLVAEIERQPGFGVDAVAIPYDLFVRKSGRIELTITAAEVDRRMSGGQGER